jgi:hypothetical protein
MLRTALLTLSILLALQSQVARAEPFEDFFDALKRAFTQPTRPRPHRATHKTATKTEANSENKTTDSDSAGIHSPPNGRNTRAAIKAGGSKNGLQYGTPVPGKKGFVTSPFSPDAGYVDVRGFPPGTAVKDPYSGKIFLTP